MIECGMEMLVNFLGTSLTAFLGEIAAQDPIFGSNVELMTTNLVAVAARGRRFDTSGRRTIGDTAEHASRAHTI